MEGHRIEAQPRGDHGKGPARKLRSTGMIPAVLYGNGVSAQSVSLEPTALALLARSPLSWNTPIHLEVSGTQHLVMVKELQRHPVSRQILHADFLVVSAEAPVTVTVPIRLEGKSQGEGAGGRLQVYFRQVKVRCLPSHIPAAIIIDLAPFRIGSRMMALDIQPPEGVMLAVERNFSLFSIEGKEAPVVTEAETAAAAKGGKGAKAAPKKK